MKFVSAQKMIEEHGRPTSTRARSSRADVKFATDITRSHRCRSPSPIYSVRFSLSKEVIKKARFMPGDKVDVLFDKENSAGLIRRTTSGGWTLSQTTTSPRISIKFTWCPGLPTIASTGDCTDIQVTDEGIMFRFPEGTSFTHNARAEQDATADTAISTAETLPIWQSRKFGK